MTVPDWFNDRPLHLETVCSRLREAVEEREKFFKFDSAQSAAVAPLELPLRPCNTGSGLENFTRNLQYRITALAAFSFPPDNLDNFSSLPPAPGKNGPEVSGNTATLTEFLAASGIAPENFYRNRPHNLSDMKFFNACAMLLNNCILYPCPPGFGTLTDDVFSWNFHMDVTDLKNGTHIARRYCPDGPLEFTSANGSYRVLAGNPAAEWKKNDLKISQSGHCFSYDASRQNNWEAVELTGKFQFQLTADWYAEADGAKTFSASDTYTYTLSPGGSTPMHIPTECQEQIALTLAADSSHTAMRCGFSLKTSEIRIKLSASNYPALPYKYLT